VITLGVLAKLEEELRRTRDEPDLKLCEFFDLVGGTSTGAIIAAGLARGMTVAEIASFYDAFGSVAFERRRLSGGRTATPSRSQHAAYRRRDPFRRNGVDVRRASPHDLGTFVLAISLADRQSGAC
jgi:predicted acylesterase/phospholipase RssA